MASELFENYMVDTFNKAKRSEIMSRVRGRGNANTELALIGLMRKHKIKGWRRHQKVFGKPDFIFRTMKLAVFVDGCFWHGCPIHAGYPSSNSEFWRKKLERNIVRDRLVNLELKQRGWRVLRIWQHELTAKNEWRVVKRLRTQLLC